MFSMVSTWCTSISSQFLISWEQLEIIVLLSLSLAFGYLLLRICDVVLFGPTTTASKRPTKDVSLEDEGDPSTYDFVHIRPAITTEIASSEEDENPLCKADTDFHFNMPQHVREEEEDNLETVIGSTIHVEKEATSYDSSSLQGEITAMGLRKRNPSQFNSTAYREISAVEGEEGYVMVHKK